MTYVYFIEDGNGHIKIGVSKDVSFRLKQLQTGNPYKLFVSHIEEYNKSQDAYTRETQLHNYLRNVKLYGEWFKGTYDSIRECDDKFKEDYMLGALTRHCRELLKY